jgi:plastocyanin
MRLGVAIALVSGFACALAIAGFPASAAGQSIAAVSNTGWNPADVSIQVNESVTWSNGTGFSHNVCVRAAGATSGCDEYRSGAPASSWPIGGYTHPFTGDGTYQYICEQHPVMHGTITVGTGINPPGTTGTGTGTGTNTGTNTGTGTSTTPPPDSQPTDTITVPVQTTETFPAATDTTAPAFVGKPKRRASRKSLVIELGSSEPGTVKATVFRRPPHGRSFARISDASLKVTQGKNVVKVPRATLRSGAYRVKLQLVDAAGNKSATRTLSFKIA